MTSKKTSKKKLEIRNSTLDISESPVVSEPEKLDFKNIFALFSTFVAVGGDFAS